MTLTAGTDYTDRPKEFRGVIWSGSRKLWECDHTHPSRVEAWNCAQDEVERRGTAQGSLL